MHLFGVLFFDRACVSAQLKASAVCVLDLLCHSGILHYLDLVQRAVIILLAVELTFRYGTSDA